MRPTVLLLPAALAALSACGASTPAHSSAAAPASSVASAPTSTSATSIAAAPAASTARRVIQVTEHGADTYTPKGGQAAPGGPTGMPAAGDQFDIRSTLIRDGKTVGTDHVHFVFGVGGSATVTATEVFADGQIIARGTVPFDPTLTIPVVSGTGAYAGATGTLTAVSQSNTLTNLTITLT